MTLIAESLSQTKPTRIRWLWEPYIPRGKLALVDGDPGVGKSLLTINLAARLSRGGFLPDGQSSERPHVTLLLSTEDEAGDTIRPRAEAAGADLDCIVTVSDLDGAPIRLPADLGALEQLIRERRADLVVLDPVMAFLPPEIASSSDQCIRRAFFQLARLAGQTDCAILLVRHLRKKGGAKAMYRGLGSIGIIGAVRAGLMVAMHPTDPNLRVLAVTKTNLARTPPALGFRVVGDDPAHAGIEWTGPMELSADALGLPTAAALKPRDRACLWLARELADGPRKVNELYAAAADTGIPEVTLKRAKQEVGARSHLVHFKDGTREWYWFDPCAPWPAKAPFKKPFELPPLEPLEPLEPL